MAEQGQLASTVFERFAASAAAFPERPFVVVLPETARAYGIAAGTLTYGDVLTAVHDLAGGLGAAGIGAGDRVGLLLENRPTFLVHWLALNALGASIVPINPDLRSAELAFLVSHSQMVLAVAIPARTADLRAAAAATGSGLTVLGLGDRLPRDVARGSGGAAADDDANRECALLYTSGTTGTPKGCILSNAYFLAAGDWYAGVGGLAALRTDPPERMLTPLPLFHMNALAYSVMATITVGGAIAILDRFHPRTWWDSVRAFEASVVHYLGVMPAMLMGAPEGPEDRRHTVRFGFGAGVERPLHAAFEARFGLPLLEAWAMTETGAGAVVIANEEPRQVGTSCFGKPAAAVDASIRGADGRECGADEPGELFVRAAGADPRRGFFTAYLKDDAATRAAWEGGWFATGDVVRRGQDGQLHFVDRKKNVIRRSGENISAAEVEAVLRGHSGIRQAAVAPLPDAVRGEEVAVLVVPKEMPADPLAARDLAEDITRFCLSRLAYYKAPGSVAFVAAIPLTATEKIQRGALRETVQRMNAAGEAIDTSALKKRSA